MCQHRPRQPQAVRGGDTVEAVLAGVEGDALRAGDGRAEGLRVQLEGAAIQVLPEGTGKNLRQYVFFQTFLSVLVSCALNT